MYKVWNIERVAAIMSQEGYTLIDTSYVNTSTKLNCICPEGHQWSVRWTDFRRGYRCSQCANNRKFSLTQVQSIFAEDGYQLLSTHYKNANSLLQYKCPNGHVDVITFGRFHRGTRCPTCSRNKKFTIEQVRKMFIDEGWELLSTEYKNNNSPLHYRCTEGHRGVTTLISFRNNGNRCPVCSHKKRKTIDEIRQILASEGYKLLSKRYKNCYTKLLYKCPKGHCGKMMWLNFQQGYRCPECLNKHEEKLGQILRKTFPQVEVRSQDNLGFLKRQRVDYYIPSLRLAFEYDGEQHFRPICFGGISIEKARELYAYTRKCDEKKNKLCKDNGIILIRIPYTEEISEETLTKWISKV